MRKRRKRRSEGNLCLHLKQPGWPEMFYWPRTTVSSDEGPVTPNGLLCAREGGRTVWAMVEFDDDPLPGAERERLERLLDIPTLRVTQDQLLQGDFMKGFAARLRQVLAEAPQRGVSSWISGRAS